jgi:DNA polymerase-3 subunit delta'
MFMTENWGMLGHEWAVELLKGHLTRGAPRHAYLFTGPRGIGRRTLALRFAQAINAEAPPAPGEFDPHSKTSQQFERMQHPDLSLVQRQEGDRDIKIEAVRSLQKMLALSPYVARYRIALFLNFEEASNSAANALLKTLEEPANPVVLMLTAESAEVLLPTITSRCEVFRLRPPSMDLIAEGLQRDWHIPEKEARNLAHISGGRPGYALYLHQNPDILEQRTHWLDEQQKLLWSNRLARFSYAESLGKDKEDFQETLRVWLSYWRDVLMQAAGSKTPLMNLDRAEEIGTLAKRLKLSAIRNMVNALDRTLWQVRANVNTRLAAEVLLLDLPYI